MSTIVLRELSQFAGQVARRQEAFQGAAETRVEDRVEILSSGASALLEGSYQRGAPQVAALFEVSRNKGAGHRYGSLVALGALGEQLEPASFPRMARAVTTATGRFPESREEILEGGRSALISLAIGSQETVARQVLAYLGGGTPTGVALREIGLLPV